MLLLLPHFSARTGNTGFFTPLPFHSFPYLSQPCTFTFTFICPPSVCLSFRLFTWSRPLNSLVFTPLLCQRSLADSSEAFPVCLSRPQALDRL